MNEFTFCVLSYNHEKYILETLESIKFLVKNYGSKLKINLIIGDDCSDDNTAAIIDFWLQKNRILFYKIVFFSNDKNIGACKTLIKIFKNIETNNFKLIEGDDLFSSNNIFELYNKHKGKNVISATSLQFINHKIINNKKIYISTLSKSLLNKKKIKLLTTISVPFNGTSMWYSSSLINKKMMKRLSNFYVIGDRNIWFSIFHDNEMENIHYDFEQVPIILYRINEFSITSKKSKKRTLYQADYQNYINSICNENLSYLEKMLYKNFVFSKKRKLKYTNILSYINKFLDKFSWIFTNKDINKLMSRISTEQEHLNNISYSSSKLLKEFYEKK